MKLIISDLDGTLLNKNSEISNYTIKIIKELIETTNIKFAIATGRSYHSAAPIKRKIGLDMYMICNNGANIYNENEVLIGKNFISKELCVKIVTLFMKHNIDYKGFKGLDMYLPEYGNVVDEAIRKEHNIIIVKKAKDIDELEKILVINEENQVLQKAKKLLEENFGNELEVVISSSVCLDINMKNCSKKLGIEIIARELEINSKDIVAFGDSGNDYKMLSYVGKPVAMKKSYMSRKNIAEITFLTNDEDGVADYIEKIILKK